ncbi:MAG TPA: DUF2232 domain-containing protein [bacterium]|nr:DUF2232 domain-containing protein [bacterium]
MTSLQSQVRDLALPSDTLGWRGVFGLGLISLALYLSGLLVWLTPLPVLYAYRKGGMLKSLVAVLIPTALLWLVYEGLVPYFSENYGAEQALKFFFWVPGLGLASPGSTWNPAIFGIVYYLFFALLGVLLGEFEPQPYRMTRLVGQTAGFVGVCLLSWLLLYTAGHWTAFVQGLEAYFVRLLEEVSKVPPGNEEMELQWSLIRSNAPSIAFYAVRLLPAMIFNMLIFVVWLNVVVSRRLFGAKAAWFPSVGNLHRWRFPFAGVWVLIGFALLLALDIYVVKGEVLKLLAINAFLVFGLVYLFQGLAIVAFYLGRWNLSPMLRLLFYSILVLFFQPLSFLLVAFGFFDSWFDFRRLQKKE